MPKRCWSERLVFKMNLYDVLNFMLYIIVRHFRTEYFSCCFMCVCVLDGPTNVVSGLNIGIIYLS